MHEVCGEHIVMAVDEECKNSDKLYSLNGAAACLWKAVVGKDFTIGQMVEALSAEYEVDKQTAHNDCQAILESWAEAGLLEV